MWRQARAPRRRFSWTWTWSSPSCCDAEETQRCRRLFPSPDCLGARGRSRWRVLHDAFLTNLRTPRYRLAVARRWLACGTTARHALELVNAGAGLVADRGRLRRGKLVRFRAPAVGLLKCGRIGRTTTRKPSKTQHGSTRKPKRNKVPTAARPASSTLADLQQQVSALTRERAETSFEKCFWMKGPNPCSGGRWGDRGA